MAKVLAALVFGGVGLVGGHLVAENSSALENPSQFIAPLAPTIYVQQTESGNVITDEARAVYESQLDDYQVALPQYEAVVTADQNEADWKVRGLGIVIGEVALGLGIAAIRTLKTPAGRRGFMGAFGSYKVIGDFANRNRRSR